MELEFLQKLKESKRDVQLSSEIKRKIRNNLLIHMENNPVSYLQTDRLISQEGLVVKIIKLYSHMKILDYRMIAPVAILVFILAGAGTAYASSEALPGDKLYSFKVNVNEQIKSNFLMFSEEAQAEAQLDLYEQRLDEAVVLSSQNKLDAKLENKIEKLFTKYQAKIDHKIAQLEKNGKTELASQLRTRMQSVIIIHQEILAQLNNQYSLALQDQLNMELSARNGEDVLGELEVDQDSEFQADGSVARKQIAAQNKINTANKIISNVGLFIHRKAEMNSDQNVTALAHLQSAIDLLIEANSQYDQGDYETAFRLAGKSLIIAQESKTFIRLNSIVDLRSNESQKIESVNHDKNIESKERSPLKTEKELEKNNQNSGQEKYKDRQSNSVESNLDNELGLEIRSQSLDLKVNSTVRSDLKLGL